MMAEAKLNEYFWSLGTAAMRCLPPELAHDIGIACLKCGVAPNIHGTKLQRRFETEGLNLGLKLPGLGTLAHPIGLAAGFDKDAACVVGCSHSGFSFVEVGTVTPLPQPGNPRPRLWRQKNDLALVNAMGFNNAGLARMADSLMNLKKSDLNIPVGVNAGKNKITDAKNALEDYAKVFSECKNLCDFFVVNLSSPNTPGLRDLATPQFIQNLSGTLSCEDKGRTWIKLSPDMTRVEFQNVLEAVSEAKFAGAILTNTHKVDLPWQGGQSGAPLRNLSNQCLEWAWDVHKGALPVIGSGGIITGADVFEKIAKGSWAVEIFTAFIYRGPLAVKLILEELVKEMAARGINNVEQIRGSYFADRH